MNYPKQLIGDVRSNENIIVLCIPKHLYSIEHLTYNNLNKTLIRMRNIPIRYSLIKI